MPPHDSDNSDKQLPEVEVYNIVRDCVALEIKFTKECLLNATSMGCISAMDVMILHFDTFLR